MVSKLTRAFLDQRDLSNIERTFYLLKKLGAYQLVLFSRCMFAWSGFLGERTKATLDESSLFGLFRVEGNDAFR